MTEAPLFVRAAGIGLAVAAPVGPMCLLCLRHAAQSGVTAGLRFGAGIAAADASFAALGAFGVAAITHLLLRLEFALHLVGALVLILLGVRALRAPAPQAGAAPKPRGGLTLTACLLTLANPQTILSFAALYAALAVQGGWAAAALFTLGVFCGSMLWWVAVAFAAARMGAKLTPAVMRAVNVLAGLGLLGFAGYSLATLRP